MLQDADADDDDGPDAPPESPATRAFISALDDYANELDATPAPILDGAMPPPMSAQISDKLQALHDKKISRSFLQVGKKEMR